MKMTDAIHTVGRRKTSVARVFLKEGKPYLSVNRRTLENYFPFKIHQMEILRPFAVAGLPIENFSIRAQVKGGGIKGQAQALRLALSRALVEYNPNLRPFLRKAGLLTVDSRQVERKHYGHKKARKSFQFSKR